MKKLYDIKHPYYGTGDGRGAERYGSWAEYVQEWADADLDMNYLYRWDWDFNDDARSEDNYYRDGTLTFFYIMQRKGFISEVEISVCKADEPEIKEFLAARWEHNKKMWEPIGGPND